MKRTAILVDGEWFRRRLLKSIPQASLPNGITADVLYRNCLLALDRTQEDLFRLFYYDCPPYAGKEMNPISKTQVNFETQPKNRARTLFLRELKTKDYVALRLGVLGKRGWVLSDNYIKKTFSGSATGPLQETDVYLSLEQKGVDMRIGIDVATLSLKKLVERIILICGDTDLIPAMKLARREGVQVILVDVDGGGLSASLDEDCDLVRQITPIS